MTNTKNRMIESAISLFQKNGYRKTSVVSICRHCNVTKATFYAYFSNKDDIIYAYFEERAQHLPELLPQLIEMKSTKEQIWRLYEYNIDSMLLLGASTCKDFFLADIQKGMLYFSPRNAEKISPSRRNQTKMATALIKKAQETGEIRAFNPEILNKTYMELIIVICLDWCSNGDDYDLKKELRQLFDTLF